MKGKVTEGHTDERKGHLQKSGLALAKTKSWKAETPLQSPTGLPGSKTLVRFLLSDALVGSSMKNRGARMQTWHSVIPEVSPK